MRAIGAGVGWGGGGNRARLPGTRAAPSALTSSGRPGTGRSSESPARAAGNAQHKYLPPRGERGPKSAPLRHLGRPGRFPPDCHRVGRGCRASRAFSPAARPNRHRTFWKRRPLGPSRRQNRTPARARGSLGGLGGGARGGAGAGAGSARGGRVRFAPGAQAPPRRPYRSTSALPLYGAAGAHSFLAGPARHLRPSAAARRIRLRSPQHVGPRRRDAVRHPDLPVREGPRGASSGQARRSPPPACPARPCGPHPPRPPPPADSTHGLLRRRPEPPPARGQDATRDAAQAARPPPASRRLLPAAFPGRRPRHGSFRRES